LIELPGVPAEFVAVALSSRGWLHYTRNNFPGFLADTEAGLSKNSSMDFAVFNLGLALLACGRDDDAFAAYQRAVEAFPQSIDDHGLKDLVEAQKSWLSEERAKPVIQLLESFNKQLAI
jgi:tetratricopeptide (TPR) repeat protein